MKDAINILQANQQIVTDLREKSRVAPQRSKNIFLFLRLLQNLRIVLEFKAFKGGGLG